MVIVIIMIIVMITFENLLFHNYFHHAITIIMFHTMQCGEAAYCFISRTGQSVLFHKMLCLSMSKVFFEEV